MFGYIAHVVLHLTKINRQRKRNNYILKIVPINRFGETPPLMTDKNIYIRATGYSKEVR